MLYPRHTPALAACLLLLAGTVLVAGTARADDPAELINDADMAYRGTSAAAVLRMTVKTKSYNRDYRIMYWDERKGSGRSLVKVLGPALWRGYGTLKNGGQLKLYNPKSNQITKVSQSMLGNRWMGSHLTNDDLVKNTRLGRHYEAKLINGERRGHYLFELTPKPTAPVAWGKVLYEIDATGERPIPVQARYFRRKNSKQPARTLTWSEVGTLGGRLLPTQLKVELAASPGEETRIRFEKIRYDVAIGDNKFTEQALRN